jgi:zinc transporter ZupT
LRVSTTAITESILAFALALVGGLLGATMAHSHRRLCALISFSAGTLLGVALFGIVPECLEALPWWELLLAASSGYAVFFLISKYVYHVCPACAASHCEEAMAQRFSEIATAMMIALAIHCTIDGLAIAAGEGAGETQSSEAGRAVGISVVLAICVHKIPEGLALGALLLGAGLTFKKIMMRVTAVESTTLLGGVAGVLFLRNASGFWLALALANAGGGFLYLALHAILGELIKHHAGHVLKFFAAGVGLIGTLVLAFHLKT